MTHYLSSHTTHTTFGELESAVRRHRDIHCSHLNRTDCAVLEFLAGQSGQHLAAHLSYEVFETALRLSNSTIRRTLRKLERLQIVRRIHYVRPEMNGLGPNIYVILPPGGHPS